MKKLVLALMVCGLVGCGEDVPPKTINEISSSIEKVEQNDNDLKIYIKSSSALTADDHFQNASMNTYSISEKLVKYFPDIKQAKLTYVISVETINKYGNSSVEPSLLLNYKIDEIKKINFSQLYHRDVLELAEPVEYLNNAGTQVINAWCKEEENYSVAKRFCAANS